MQLARYLIAPAGSLAQTSSATHIPICTTYLDEFFVLVISQFRGYPKQGSRNPNGPVIRCLLAGAEPGYWSARIPSQRKLLCTPYEPSTMLYIASDAEVLHRN
ncbi:hypothetical protein PCH_Pc22g15240 [Penicillium rubens Wisconsin 54-1255]|uniref:Uncharacterized protein n=1 Tax=Penicillium rubens (strain ATCC 28089 / DSM 1075 / NRRL 1951 / Wisconsin 54-1255) TaxID=500485 RepID=B6HVP3_PENRW|nr:hypothetical protein PCH_Pc22g15240 [Penicillium rubens Wisconsin 54-1255]